MKSNARDKNVFYASELIFYGDRGSGYYDDERFFFYKNKLTDKVWHEVNMSFGVCWDLPGTFPPNWICKNCGFMWNNITELKTWSKKAQMGEELFDINLVDYENAENGIVNKKGNSKKGGRDENNRV